MKTVPKSNVYVDEPSPYQNRLPASLWVFFEMVFLQGQNAFGNVKDADIGHMVNVLRDYQVQSSRRGADFIFLPVPNKESIYYQPPSHEEKAESFLPGLITALRKENIPVVDTLAAFRDYAKNHRNLIYQLDDTHWNGTGVEIATSLLVAEIKKMENQQP